MRTLMLCRGGIACNFTVSSIPVRHKRFCTVAHICGTIRALWHIQWRLRMPLDQRDLNGNGSRYRTWGTDGLKRRGDRSRSEFVRGAPLDCAELALAEEVSVEQA